VELAEQNKILLMLERLVEAGKVTLPGEVVSEIRMKKRAVLKSQLANIALHFRVLAKYLKPLGITYAYVKGLPVAQFLYEQITDREFCDIDILVNGRDMHRLVRALESDGFRVVNPCWSSQDTRLLAEFINVIELISPSGEILELHRTLDQNGVLFSSKRLLERRVLASIAGTDCWILDDASMVDYLVFHHSRHKWCSLHWCQDLMLIAEGRYRGTGLGRSESELMLRPTIAAATQLAHDLRAMARGRELARFPSPFLEDCLRGVANGVEAQHSPKDGELRDPDFRYPWQRTAVFNILQIGARFRPRFEDVVKLPLPRWLWWAYWLWGPMCSLRRRLSS
jgi:hypothetical protein